MTQRLSVQLLIIVCLSAAIGFGLFFVDRKTSFISRYLPTDFIPQDSFTYGALSQLKDPNYFNDVKGKFILEKKDFVEANLSEMKLRVYKEGNVLIEVPIQTKGREGSWWETPSGIYTAQSKARNHRSSLGGVYMPWSVAFQGNFFIHGWPYYEGGAPVSTSYSGGCIRLTTEDAEKIYPLISVGTPILVHENSFADDGILYTQGNSIVTASSYLIGDLQNGFIFSEKEKNEKRPIASVTKLMTAIVSVEYMNIEKEISSPGLPLATTSVPRLKPHTFYTLYDLLYPLLQESSNEAAQTIARGLGTSWFVSLMNDKAKAIGMSDTNFVDPSGAGAQNVSTPTDLFRLAKYLHHNRSFILRMSAGTAETHIYGETRFADLENFNIFTEDPSFVGGKIGRTLAAGDTGLFIFNLPFGTTTRPIAVVLLNSKNLYEDTQALLSFAKNSYRLNQ